MRKIFLSHTWAGFLAHTLVMVLAGFLGGKILTSALNETIQPIPSPTQVKKEARLVLSPPSALVAKGSRIAVRILVYPGSVNINAVGATINYPRNLRVVELSRLGSFCTLYPEETVSPNTRTIRLACGTPNPGLTTSSGIVGTVIFEALENGQASVTIKQASSSVHANDGKGTDVLATVENNVLTIATPPAPSSAKIALPKKVVLTSPTHPQPDHWYISNNPVIHWLQEKGVQYAFSLDKNPQGVPDSSTFAKTGLEEFPNVADGVWYAHVRGRNSAGLGSISHLKIQIDTTPPQLNVQTDRVTLAQNESIELNFSGEDAQEFYVKVANESFTLASSPLKILNLTNGENSIYVQAVDRAGNITQKSVKVYVQSGFWEGLWLQIRRLLFR